MTDQFPVGLRVLVVDDDRTCLAILEKMLRNCSYNVTTCGTAKIALAMLRENRQCYDLVISDVYMPDMDGFKLLELVGLEMDLPVIMMSADGETSVVMKGITHGACDYLIKPIRMKELRNIWQHVIRKRRNVIKDVDSSALPEQKRRPEDADSYLPANTRKRASSKEEEEDEFDTEDSTSLKKPRVVWSVELHQQFVTAVNQLGIDKAVPKRILELMHVQGLTRENVASHLQKYRLYLKRLAQQPSYDVLSSHPVITPGSIQSAYLARPNGMNSVDTPPVFVVRPRIPPPGNNQRFPSVPDLDQLAKAQAPPTIVGQPNPIQHFSPNGIVGVGEVGGVSSLAEQLLQHQPQPPHQHQQQYVQDFRSGSLEDIPKSTGPVKREQPDPRNGGWNGYPGYNRLGWQQEADLVHSTGVPSGVPPGVPPGVPSGVPSGVPYGNSIASFDKPGDVLLQSQDYTLLGPSRISEQMMNTNYNNNMKVKEEIEMNGFALDELSSVCYKPEHESGFFYNELGLDGYNIHGNLYVK